MVQELEQNFEMSTEYADTSGQWEGYCCVDVTNSTATPTPASQLSEEQRRRIVRTPEGFKGHIVVFAMWNDMESTRTNVKAKTLEFEVLGRKLETEFAHLKFTFIGPCSKDFFKGYVPHQMDALEKFVPALINNCANAIYINPEQLLRYMTKADDNTHLALTNANVRYFGLITRHCLIIADELWAMREAVIGREGLHNPFTQGPSTAIKEMAKIMQGREWQERELTTRSGQSGRVPAKTVRQLYVDSITPTKDAPQPVASFSADGTTSSQGAVPPPPPPPPYPPADVGVSRAEVMTSHIDIPPPPPLEPIPGLEATFHMSGDGDPWDRLPLPSRRMPPAAPVRYADTWHDNAVATSTTSLPIPPIVADPARDLVPPRVPRPHFLPPNTDQGGEESTPSEVLRFPRSSLTTTPASTQSSPVVSGVCRKRWNKSKAKKAQPTPDDNRTPTPPPTPRAPQKAPPQVSFQVQEVNLESSSPASPAQKYLYLTLISVTTVLYQNTSDTTAVGTATTTAVGTATSTAPIPGAEDPLPESDGNDEFELAEAAPPAPEQNWEWLKQSSLDP